MEKVRVAQLHMTHDEDHCEKEKTLPTVWFRFIESDILAGSFSARIGVVRMAVIESTLNRALTHFNGSILPGV